jgi:hypothetical protein
MKKTLLALAIAGAAVSAQADVSISGHVNYSAGNLEDFNGNEGFDVQNNGASGSRFRIVASKEANGITYGTRQELGLSTGGSASVSKTNGADGTADTLDDGVSISNTLNTRISQFTISGDFGQFSLGQGWEAGDDAAEQDKSGTYVLTGSAFDAWDVGGNFNNVDGGRDNRLRYDSPKLGGVAKISADLDTNDNLGLALALSGSSWSAGLFTEQKDATGSADEIGGSVAVNFGGFTAALQLGETSGNGATTDTSYSGVILGYRVGKVSVALDFASYEEEPAAGGAATVDNGTTGLSFVYRPTGGVELYAGVRKAESDLAGATPFQGQNDATGVLVGGRVKF